MELAVAVVVGDAEIEAAWPAWDTTSAETTTWTCWVVTERILGHVRVEYERGFYDEHAEREHKLTPSSRSSWVRPLNSVTRLQWGAFYEAPEKDDAYHPAEPIKVKFPNWETPIPDGGLPVEQRSTADRFLTALRKGANL